MEIQKSTTVFIVCGKEPWHQCGPLCPCLKNDKDLVFMDSDLVGCVLYCIKTVGDEDDGGVGMFLFDVE